MPNSELLESKCAWTGNLPDYQQTVFCTGCQKQCSAPDVLRCQLKGPAPPPEAKTPQIRTVPKPVVSMPPRLNTGIGDCLKVFFDTWKIKASQRCSCADIKETLNLTPPAEVERRLDYYVDQVFDNIKNLSGIMGGLVKAGAFLMPGTARDQIKTALSECVAKAKEQNAPEAS